MVNITSRIGLATGIAQFDDYLAAPAHEHPIHITSGEGEVGTTEVYTGKRTDRAIKMRLTLERCHGGRWARAEIYMHDTDDGVAVGMDCTDGGVCYFPEGE